MKKLFIIVYGALAVVFFSKEIIYSFSSMEDSSCFTMEDFGQKESKESSEKDGIDEKEEFNEGGLGHSLGAMLLHNSIGDHFRNHKDKTHFTPYFEVFSPPPELA